MSAKKPHVSREVRVEDVNALPGPTELPEHLHRAAVCYEALGEDWIDEFSRKKVVLRKSGYQMPTMLLFFLALFTGSFSRSIKTACRELNRPRNRLLAAFAGLEKFPEQSSVSRFLVRATQAPLEEAMGWMLVFSHPGLRELLTHPAAACRDTFGEPWHLFDLDPTATVLRQRAVSEDDEYPPAERPSDSIARAGYMGRKRGDVLFRRTVLQHAGSTLWLGSWLRPGSGGSRETFAAAIKTVVQCCEFAGVDKERAVLRIDGEGGNVPTLTACMEAGIGYVTRCVHASLLERSDVRRKMMAGSWFEVADTGSGPRRYALDLGELELFPSSNTLRDDGTPYEPVRTRIVLSRYAACEKSSSGVFIDNVMYELFATSLTSAAWPAEEIVALYCQRAAQENQFAREDKELGLDTVFNYHPPGQGLVTLIGLLVWNLELLMGLRLAEQELKSESFPPASFRQSRPAPAPLEAVEPGEEDGCKQSEEENTPAVPSALDTPHPLATLKHLLFEEIARQAQGSWPNAFDWDMTSGLICPQGHGFAVSTTRRHHGNDYVTLLAPRAVCSICGSRHECSRSTKPDFRKEVALAIENPHPIDQLLRQIKQAQTEQNRTRPHVRCVSKRPAAALSHHELEPEFTAHTAFPPGPLEIQFPSLNAPALRHRFKEANYGLTIRIREWPEPVPALPRRYTYMSRQDRGRHRRTWAERLAYNHRKAKIDVHILRTPIAANLFSTA
jgi:hypothetical protein